VDPPTRCGSRDQRHAPATVADAVPHAQSHAGTSAHPLRPAEGVPPRRRPPRPEIASAAARLQLAARPASAGDAERASGFRDFQPRANLIQHPPRSGAGTALIDPVDHGGSPLDARRSRSPTAWAADEWILHAADQDPAPPGRGGAAPAGPPPHRTRRPPRRLPRAGTTWPRWWLRPARHSGLAKGHGACRLVPACPCPHDWLHHPALDVEVLLELRHAAGGHARRSEQRHWAAEGFETCAAQRAIAPVVTAGGHFGLHKVRSCEVLAAVRELWTVRDRIARGRDIAPGRILPDCAITGLLAALAHRRASRNSPHCRSSAAPGYGARPRSGWTRCGLLAPPATCRRSRNDERASPAIRWKTTPRWPRDSTRLAPAPSALSARRCWRRT